MTNTLYNTDFRYAANRYEEWRGGKCISRGPISTVINAEIKGNIIHFELDNIGDISMLKSFDLYIYGENHCILPDRIQYFRPTSDFNPSEPIVCHLFCKGTTIDYVRFAMTNPDRIVEFYGDLVQVGQKSINKPSGHHVVDLSNFYFESRSHQRFEPTRLDSIPLQCNVGRGIKIENNISGDIGCYTMTIYNLDGNHPIWGNNIQISPKPMKIVEQSNNKIVLRGYGYDMNAIAMGVSKQEASFADYGMEIYHSDRKVIKCVFHRYDSNFSIEYYSGSNGLDASSQTISQPNQSVDEHAKNSLCLMANGFMGALRIGNEYNANLISWNYYLIIHEKPYLLTMFSPQQYDLISRITSMLISNPKINQSESRILECTNYGFYCLHRALEYKDKEVLHQMRISLMADTHKWFYKTVADALGISSKSFDLFSPLNMPLIVRTNRDYYYMGYYDFEMSVNKNYEGNMLEFQRLVYDNCNNSIDKGRANIAKTAKYIEDLLLSSYNVV